MAYDMNLSTGVKENMGNIWEKNIDQWSVVARESIDN